MVASSAPLDQFVVRNPSYFFDASPERALIDPDNLHILVDHVKCAAFELPFTGAETFGRHDVQEILGVLAEQGLVHRAGRVPGRRRGRGRASADASGPGRASRIRPMPSACGRSRRTTSSSSTRRARRASSARPISRAGPPRCIRRRSTSSKAQLYQVERLDFEGRKAFVREIDCDYYTDAITYTRVTILDTFRRSRGTATRLASHGEVHVVSRVVGFKKIKFYTNENVGSGELDLPEQQMHTTSYWLTIPAAVMGAAAVRVRRSPRRHRRPRVRDAAGGAAAADVRSPRHRHFDRHRTSGRSPTGTAEAPDARKIFVYDNYPGGIGFSEPLFRMHHELLEGTRRLIAECECENGCPGCVGPVGNTGPLAKTAALGILDRASGRGGRGLTWSPSTLADRLRAIVKARRFKRRPVSRPRGPAGRPVCDEQRSNTILGGDWCRRDGLSCFVVERRYGPGRHLRSRSVGDRCGAPRRRVGGSAARDGRRSGAATVRLLRSRDDRPERRRRHVRVSRRLRRVRR